MSDLDLWSALLGFVAPLVVAVIDQPHWPALAKVIVTVAVSVGGGFLTAALSGAINAHWAWLHASLVVLTAAVVFYRTLWLKPASALEAATKLSRR